jgi:exosome complex exonuclease DIS3/RRP44
MSEKQHLATLKNDDAEDSGEEGEEENDILVKESRHIQSEKRTSEKQPTARIVGIIKRNWRAYVISQFMKHDCTFKKNLHSYVCHIDSTSLTSSNTTSLSQQTVFATPVSRLLPRIRLRTRQAPSLIGQKILVTIDRWDVTSRYPEGHFVRALGKVESKEAEQESLLLEFEVPYRPFGKAILDCLPEQGEQWVVPVKSMMSPEWKDREDLRNLLICSIDPPSEFRPFLLLLFTSCANHRICLLDCQDIDDALHARLLPNGNIEAGVRKSS